MTHYNTLNVKLTHSYFNKLKSTTKNKTEATLNLSSNLIGNFNDKTYFTPTNYSLLIHKLRTYVKLLKMAHQLI